MKTEILVNGDLRVMDVFESLFGKYKLSAAMGNAIIKAGSEPPERRSQIVVGTIKQIALAILKVLTKEKEYEGELHIGKKITVITQKDSPIKIQKTITSHTGIRFFFKLKG